jgi:hypothetical protein
MLIGAAPLAAQAPNLEGKTQRPLRYRPDGPDFVIENGEEFFNRSLYGGNTAFRVDGGDKPEFVMYLPGRGGNLRLAVRTQAGVKWLHEAAHVVTRYRPGELRYEIRDDVFGKDAVVNLDALAYYRTEGLIVRAGARGLAAGAEFVWVYGGVNGERGARDGDVGTERVPISQYFQFKPEFASSNRITISPEGFTLRSRTATIAGPLPEGATLSIAGAAQWNDLASLLAAAVAESTQPILVGRAPLPNGKPLYLSLQRIDSTGVAGDLATYREVTAGSKASPDKTITLDPVYRRAELPAQFDDTRKHFDDLRNKVSIDTPDPYLNAAAGALNVVSDALWDESAQAIMHGSIAWRTKLLGWRGPYVLDALGWHDRARRNFNTWTVRQNTSRIPSKLPPADEKSNLSRNEAGLHSNGDISNSHYDMNMVFIDALFRHLLWTGDIAYAREVWPVIERHLAWEQRLFRREFGSDKLPLYEAYATIWASDDIYYNGGGVSYSSAYNFYANKMAAKVARLIGKDPATYDREAELIAKAMRTYLWMPDKGAFAEYKDLLGNQLLHPSYGLWTFYHTIDSEVPDSQEAWQMATALDRNLREIPVQGHAYVLPTTDWMPYSWSVNNVVMGENLHTALAYWEAGRPDQAYRLAEGALLASMYMGISPGNVGTMDYLDVYRRESQRDFADGSGVMSRALVEGLFGIRPDALSQHLTVAPGFPVEWTHARLTHPDVSLNFTEDGLTDRWEVAQTGNRFKTLTLRVPARFGQASVEADGQTPQWRFETLAGRVQVLSIEVPFTAKAVVKVHWPKRTLNGVDVYEPTPSPTRSNVRKSAELNLHGETVDLSAFFNDRVTEIFKPGKYLNPRSPYVSLSLPSQGMGAWAGHVNAISEIDDSGLRRVSAANGGKLTLPNGIAFATPSAAASPNIVFTSQWVNYPQEVTIPLSGRAWRVHLLMAGSTNFMQSRLDNGEVIVTYSDGATERLALNNPLNWWPIDQDYFIDDYQFHRDGPIPPRVDLKTGKVRLLDEDEFKGKARPGIPGGSATVLELPLDPGKALKSLTVRTLCNDVVIGLMSVTLERR